MDDAACEMILQDVAAVTVVKGAISVIATRRWLRLAFPVIRSPSPSLSSRDAVPRSFVRPTVIFSSHFFDGASAQILSPSLSHSHSVSPSFSDVHQLFFFSHLGSTAASISAASDFALFLPPSSSSALVPQGGAQPTG